MAWAGRPHTAKEQRKEFRDPNQRQLSPSKRFITLIVTVEANLSSVSFTFSSAPKHNMLLGPTHFILVDYGLFCQ